MVAARRRSRKPSAGSASPPPDRPPLVFFTDECLGRNAVPDALRAAGCVVERHCDVLPSGIDDVAMLRALAPRAGELVLLTKDGRIRHRRLELQALKAAGLRVFCLTSAQLTGPDQGQAFVGAITRMRRLAATTPGPFVARVTGSSDVELIPIEWT